MPFYKRPKTYKRRASLMSYPADLKYTKEHEWIRVDGDTGADRHHRLRASSSSATSCMSSCPTWARRSPRGQVFGTIESVKAVSELFAPVTGEVVEINGVAQGSPRSRQQQAARDVDGEGEAREPGRDRVADGCRRVRATDSKMKQVPFQPLDTFAPDTSARAATTSPRCSRRSAPRRSTR